MKKSKSSKRWLKEHFSDVYVKRAQKEGYRARSVYKLQEIQERYGIIGPNMLVVDLGAAPGGWSELVGGLLDTHGRIIALDILPLRSLPRVEFIQGDFTKDEVLRCLLEKLNGQKVDVVLSDMAPNLSGVSVIDQMRSIDLIERGFSFAQKVLKPEGTFLSKVFQSSEVDDFLRLLRKNFTEVKVIKPDASSVRSSEIFLLARNFKKASDI